VFRRERLPEEERFSISIHRIYEIISNELSPSKSIVGRVLTVILVFSIALSIGIIFFAITNSEVGEKFTEFYILGHEGKAANYTTANLKYNTPATVLVGVANSEYAFVNYTVQVALGGEVLAEKRLMLGNNESWKGNITFVPDKKGKDLKLVFWLFKEDNLTAPYRDLHLWVNVTATTATPVVTDTPVPEATPTGEKISVKLDSQRGFFSLIQGSVKIQPGDEVIFTNDGTYAVTLVSAEKLFEPKSLDNDKRMNYIFKKTGTYGFYLKENKNLNGTIVVEP
jgi:plastocyanin